MYWICDPSHAWLKVKLLDVIKAGVAEKISSFSYLHGQYAFLEEDCDATVYLLAINCQKDIPSKYYRQDSIIRTYQRFPKGSIKQIIEAIA